MSDQQERVVGGVILLRSQLFDFCGFSRRQCTAKAKAMSRFDVYLRTLSLLHYRLLASRLYKDVLSITPSDQSRLGVNADETENVQRDLVPAKVEEVQNPVSPGRGELTCSTELEMSNDWFSNILPPLPFQMISL